MNKIVVVGAGYVGMSIAVMLAVKNEVVIVEKNIDKINKINKKISPIKDKEIDEYLANKDLNLRATEKSSDIFKDANHIIIATPTDFNEQNNFFDTTIVESVIDEVLAVNKNALLIIKSTLPIGFTEMISNKKNTNKIIFAPEFLREGSALKDNLFPSRIIFGGNNSDSLKSFSKIMLDSIQNKQLVEVFYMSSKEAESVKLFSNSYLAMRVAFFNEIDNFGIHHNIDSAQIINGVCSDNRIGNHYNNPSFGYGGYCLPKDTRQLLKNFEKIPQSLITSIIDSNEKRKKFIVDDILKRNPEIIGVFRLNMKTNSDNFRNSSVLDILKKLHNVGIKVIIFEPLLECESYEGFPIIKNLDLFKEKSDLIISNRKNDDINDVNFKTYTRDIFNRD